MVDQQARDPGISRRTSRRTLVSSATGAALWLAGCGAPAASPEPAPPPAEKAASAPTVVPAGSLKQGGVLKIAVIGEAPAVADSMFTTATITSNISQQLFEGLFARDAKLAPKPMLVDKYTAAPDGKLYEFALRKGIKFHNGKDLTAADVVASLKRWSMLSGRGRTIFNRLESVEARDSTTVTMAFKEPTGVLLDFLSLPEAFIMPAEIAEASGRNQLPSDKLIGTGPFKFAEHQVDRFLRLVRNEAYAPRSEPADGASGKKVAYVDELRIIPVPDESVRTNGMVTGEYHFNDTAPPDHYDQIKGDSNLVPLIVKPYYWYCPHFNKRQGLFTDVVMRRAVAYAFSAAECMVAGFGRQEFIRSDPGIAAPETTWHSTAGQDVYNKPDPNKARALLKEAGYNGQTVRWLATKEYFYNYPMADYVKQKLEAVGVKVELVVSDWATLVRNRARPEAYEIFLTGHSGYSHPATQPFNDKEWPGFWDNAEKDRLVGAMIAEPDTAKQRKIIDDYQKLIYDEMPFVKAGDNFLLRVARKEVKGYVNPPDWFFWNVSLG